MFFIPILIICKFKKEEDLNHLHINRGVPALLRSAHVHAVHGEVDQHVHAVHGEVVQHVQVVLVHQVQIVIAHQFRLVNVRHDSALL